MPIDAIIADWNGTLISDRNESPILTHIAVSIAKSLIPFHPVKLARLYRAKHELNCMYGEKRRDEEFDFVRQMYEVYNKKMIRGTPMSIIQDSVKKYATMPEVKERLDYGLLELLRDYHKDGKTCGILSAGYGYGIDQILKATGYRELFDFLIGDRLIENGGKAERFVLDIYRNKAAILKKLLDKRKIDPQKTAYIGDTEDDEGCFKMVGYSIVPFFASDDFRVHCQEVHDAFVPGTKDELVEFFEKNK